jgi:hypothetical protein
MEEVTGGCGYLHNEDIYNSYPSPDVRTIKSEDVRSWACSTLERKVLVRKPRAKMQT